MYWILYENILSKLAVPILPFDIYIFSGERIWIIREIINKIRFLSYNIFIFRYNIQYSVFRYSLYVF